MLKCYLISVALQNGIRSIYAQGGTMDVSTALCLVLSHYRVALALAMRRYGLPSVAFVALDLRTPDHSVARWFALCEPWTLRSAYRALDQAHSRARRNGQERNRIFQIGVSGLPEQEADRFAQIITNEVWELLTGVDPKGRKPLGRSSGRPFCLTKHDNEV